MNSDLLPALVAEYEPGPPEYELTVPDGDRVFEVDGDGHEYEQVLW